MAKFKEMMRKCSKKTERYLKPTHLLTKYQKEIRKDFVKEDLDEALKIDDIIRIRILKRRVKLLKKGFLNQRT